MLDDNKHLLRDRYRILKWLSSGATAKVYLAEDTAQKIGDNLRAVKELDPQTNDPEERQEFCDRFEVEATYLGTLDGFNGQIPRLYDYFSLADGDGKEKRYIVQEYIEGQTLRKAIEDGRVLSESRVKEILISLLPVIAYIHSKDFIHRDINPANIILRAQDDLPVLIDFGAVKEMLTTMVASSDDEESLTLVVGKKGYMAPEHLNRRPLPASDLYSLGITSIELLTGLKSWEIDRNPVIDDSFWSKHAPNVSQDFAEVVGVAVKKSLDRRYKDATSMLKALEAVVLPESDENFRQRLGDSLTSLLERQPKTSPESYKKCYAKGCDFYVTVQDKYCLNCGAYNLYRFDKGDIHLLCHTAEEHLKHVDPEHCNSTVIRLGLQAKRHTSEIAGWLCTAGTVLGFFFGGAKGEGFFDTISSAFWGGLFGLLMGALLATTVWLLAKAVLFDHKHRLLELDMRKERLHGTLTRGTKDHQAFDYYLNRIEKETQEMIEDIRKQKQEYEKRLLIIRSALKKHSGAAELQKEEGKFERALEEFQLKHKKYQVKRLEIKLLRLHNKLQAKTERTTVSEETYSNLEEEMGVLSDLVNQMYSDMKGANITSEKGKGWLARIYLAHGILEKSHILLIKQQNDLLLVKRQNVAIEPSEDFVTNLNRLNTYITYEDFFKEYQALKSDGL